MQCNKWWVWCGHNNNQRTAQLPFKYSDTSHTLRTSPMASTAIFFISLAVFLSLYCSANPNMTTESAAHAALNGYGFPAGLLPENVVEYNLNDTTGSFSVDFGGACRYLLPPDNYLASFSKMVSGKIATGRITELEGFKVKAYFKWWSVTGIRASGDSLVFDIGLMSSKYPVNNFKQSPRCEGRHHSSY